MRALLRPAVTLLGLGLGLVPALALDPNTPLNYFQLDHYTKQDGLPSAGIKALAMTPDGYLWAGTEEGIARFDGVRFEVYNSANTPSLRNHAVLEMFTAADGRLWVQSFGGLLTVRDQGKFVPAQLDPKLEGKAAATMICDDKKQIWVSFAGGLARADGTRMVAVDDPALAEIPADASLVGFDHAAPVLSNGQATYRYTSRGVVDEIRWTDGAAVAAVACLYSAGGVAVVTADRGEGSLEGTRLIPNPNPTFPSAPGLAALTRLTADGSVYRTGIADGEQLVRRLNGRDQARTLGGDSFGVRVLSMTEDPSGTLWVGTGQAGLYRLRDTPSITLGEREGYKSLGETALGIDAHGAVWSADREHLCRVDPGPVECFPAKHPNPDAAIVGIAAWTDDSLLIGYYGGGVFRYKAGVLTKLVLPIESQPEHVVALTELGDSVLLATELGALLVTRDGKATLLDIPPDVGIAGIGAYRDKEQRLWVGTLLRGLWRQNGATFEPVDEKIAACGFARLPDDTLLIGTVGGGIAVTRDGSSFQFVRTTHGLPSDSVCALLPASDGTVWLGTNQGVAQVQQDDLLSAARGERPTVSVRLIGVHEGLRAGEVVTGGTCAYQSASGYIWVRTPEGLGRVDPRRVVAHRAPSVVIDSIECGSTVVRAPAAGESIALAAGTRTCRIKFTGTDMDQAARTRFRYRFDRDGEQWTDLERAREVSIGNLAPGTQQISFAAGHDEGEWSDTPTTVRLRVEPLWWQTTTAKAIALLAVAGLAWSLHRMRLQRLEARRYALEQVVAERTQQLSESNRNLEQRVADGIAKLRDAERLAAYGRMVAGVAHEIRHPIFALKSAAFVIAHKAQSLASELANPLRTLESETSRMTRLMDDLLQFARPDKLTRRELVVADLLDDAVSAFRAAAPEATLEVQVDVGPGVESWSLDRDRMIQVVVNLLMNVRKHATNATRVELTAERTFEGDLRLSVTDNGGGIDPQLQADLFEPFRTGGNGTGLGLAIVRRIVEGHRGTIDVAHTGSDGTRLTIALPPDTAPAASDVA